MNGARRAIGFLLASALLCGCGGGGAPSAAISAAPTPTATAPAASGTGTLIATITVPLATASVKRSAGYRHVSYVPASATHVTIAVNGATAQSFPVSPGPNTLSFTAPVGSDTIVFTLYGRSASPLAAGTATANVALNTSTPIAVTLLGIPAALSVSVTGATPPLLTPSSANQAVVTATDADGNIITGTYANAVTLATSDFHATVTPTSIVSDGVSAQLTFDGICGVGETITASATGSTPGTATFVPAPAYTPSTTASLMTAVSVARAGQTIALVPSTTYDLAGTPLPALAPGVSLCGGTISQSAEPQIVNNTGTVGYLIVTSGTTLIQGITFVPNPSRTSSDKAIEVSGGSTTLDSVSINGGIIGLDVEQGGSATFQHSAISSAATGAVDRGVLSITKSTVASSVTAEVTLDNAAGSPQLTLTDSTIAGSANGITFLGTSSTTVIVTESTIAGHTGGYEMQLVSGLNLTVLGSILWNGAATIYNPLSAPASVSVADTVEAADPAGITPTNVVNVDPGLGSLSGNGGFAQTETIGTGSSAYHLVRSCYTSSDERMNPRPAANCSAGAYQP